MKKCPYCAEEIQDDAIKCKHCREWLNKSSTSSNQTLSSQIEPSDFEKLPFYKIILRTCIKPEKSKPFHKFIVVMLFLLALFICLGIYGLFILHQSHDSIPQSSEEVDKSNNDSQTSDNNPFSTGQTMGYMLGQKDSYYKGDTWIENECTAFLKDTMGESPTSNRGYMFIRGCIAGYQQAFGK